jgi:CubicO group peptidase (beta-lactamase class C family)
MQRWSGLVVGLLLSLCFATGTNAQLQLTAAPNCPTGLPAACAVPATHDEATRWAAARACLNALVRERPDHFPGAIIGYQIDVQNVPRLYAAGAADTGFEGNQTNRIVSLASAGKPLTFIAALKMIQDHLGSADCTVQPATRCIFPQGMDTPLKLALQRLDVRNGTTVHDDWFTSQYLGSTPADRALQQSWRDAILVRHLFVMTSGFPDITFIGHKFCDGPECAAPNDFVCPTAPTRADPECWYSRLYNNYLLNRGGSSAPLPPECSPRLPDGPRLADFKDYYNGQVYHPTRMAQRFERRYAPETGVQSDCVFRPAGWVDGRQARLADIARFYFGAPLQSAPGTEYHYANPNLVVLSYLVEAVTRMPFNVFLRREIFLPLGMTDTFFIVDTTRPHYQPGGPLHYVVHDPTGPADHSTCEQSTPDHFARTLDLKRVPRNRNWVTPHLAAPLHPALASVFGADKNWDESRHGWTNCWAPGGAYSTAADLLRFLRFFRNGLAPDGRVLLQPAYLALALEQGAGDEGPRTFVFVKGASAAVSANGLWGTYMARNHAKKLNYTVLMQTLTDLPYVGAYAATNCEFSHGNLLALRGAVVEILSGIE